MKYVTILDSANFNFLDAPDSERGQQYSTYQGEINILSGITLPSTGDQEINPQFDIATGSSDLTHDNIRTYAEETTGKPVEVLDIGDQALRYYSTGFDLGNNITVSGTFFKDELAHIHERERRIPNAALAIGIKSIWASLILAPYYREQRPSDQDARSVVKLLDSETGHDYATILDSDKPKKEIVIMSGDQQINSILCELDRNL